MEIIEQMETISQRAAILKIKDKIDIIYSVRRKTLRIENVSESKKSFLALKNWWFKQKKI